MRAVADGVTTLAELAKTMGVEEDRARSLVSALVDEGLLVRSGKRFTLP
jgi:DNA-binding IclR family transcriptional regulator